MPCVGFIEEIFEQGLERAEGISHVTGGRVLQVERTALGMAKQPSSHSDGNRVSKEGNGRRQQDKSGDWGVGHSFVDPCRTLWSYFRVLRR